MRSFTLIHVNKTGHELYYFNSNREDINGISFGGESFASELMDAEVNGMDRDQFEETHPGWSFVQRLVVHFGINFEPEKHEDLIIDQIPDMIEVEVN